MIIRFRLPDPPSIDSDQEEASDFGLGFEHEFDGHRFNCQIVGIGKGVRIAGDWQVEIMDKPAEANLSGYLAERPPEKLAELIFQVARICIRSLRYGGNIPQLREIWRDPVSAVTLGRLKAETSTDGQTWNPVPGELERILAKIIIGPPKFDLSKSQRVAVLIATGAESIPAGDEFIVNASDHFLQGNFRLAILESVIGLEIVLTQALDGFLRYRTKMPDDHRKQVLSPSMTLELRLKGLLYWILPEEALKQFDLKKVLKVVSWRNTIVHGPKLPRKTDWTRVRPEGHRPVLPKELEVLPYCKQEELVKEHLIEVIKLVTVLKLIDDTQRSVVEEVIEVMRKRLQGITLEKPSNRSGEGEGS